MKRTWVEIQVALVLVLTPFALYGQTIEEKCADFVREEEERPLGHYLDRVNAQLKELRQTLQETYEKVNVYHDQGVPEGEYRELLTQVNQLRADIFNLEKKWRDLSVQASKQEAEGYGLWDQEETTLNQLILEYGSPDYLYVIPPEIFSMKLQLHSGIPIPRESWSALLEIILSQNGIGIKQLNPYTRQLYLFKQDLVAVDHILDKEADLLRVPPKARIAYIFSPPLERVKGVTLFFERFRDPKMTFVYQVGHKIAMIASKEEVEKLLTLYDVVWEKENGRLIRVFPLSRIKPIEMEKILNAYFGEAPKKSRMNFPKSDVESLVIFPLTDEGSLVLIGPEPLVERAETLIRDIEKQIEDPMAMTVYWYHCRHSDPIDIAEVLEKVYTSLIFSRIERQEPSSEVPSFQPPRPLDPSSDHPLLPPPYGPPPYSTVVHPPPVVAGTIESQKEKSYTTNFIPYPKTGAIMMVVRRDTLDKIKQLIKKLDVPKKMVQIEVLLFEKRIRNHNNFGINLLRLGSGATNTHETGFKYENGAATLRKGIADFFLFRRHSSSFPAFDIAYHFLMAQEDIRINAAPSITTLNQTPAQISFVEEISIDNGAAAIDTNKGISYQQSYSRAQYGTSIVITPTIHDLEFPEDEKHFVTLETNISFDTIKKNIQNDRPAVSRRHIENHVRVVDGETVILGGLREKTAEDSRNKLPFLGELPGIGKLFGDSKMTDEKTELFFFITPHIIFDAKGELDQLKKEQLMKRPGDLPEFLDKVQKARKRGKLRLFNNSFKLLFGSLDGSSR